MARRARKYLFPVFFGFFVLFDELFVLFFFQLLGRLDLKRICAHHFQIGATLVTAQGIAFVHILFVNIDRAITYGTRDHKFLPKIPLYETPWALPTVLFEAYRYFFACIARRRRVVAGTTPLRR